MTYTQTYDQGPLFMNYMNAKTYLDSHRDDYIPSFALAPHSTQYITERFQTLVIVAILDSKNLVIIAGPYEQLTPITYADPTGHLPVLVGALIAGILVGASIGVGANIVGQVMTKGWDEIDWLSVIGSGLLGGAVGVATVLGGAAGMASVGFVVEGYSLSAGAAFALSAVAVSAGNMLDYSFKAHGEVTPEGLWEAGWKGALKGAAAFVISFVSGTRGLFLEKTHSSLMEANFFFINPSRAWIQQTLLYRLFGEFAVRPLFASAPAALIRWLIDQW